MSIQNINNIKSINHYQIKLDNEEQLAQACMRGECGHGTEDRCAQKIATEGWHECVEEKRLLTVHEYMMLPPTVAEEFVKLWMKDNNGLCSRIMVDNLRNEVADLKANDPLGILTMFAFIVGNPADETLRAEFYKYLGDEEDYVGPAVTESNFFWEMETSMKTFANIKRAEMAWMGRITAHAGPDCDQCGNARTGIGGRVCELCDLVHTHNHVICHCCVDREDEDEDYDDGNQPPRWKDAVRRTHDDGFDDDYDGEDECEETQSQEEERRQEMAENAERQMDDWRDRSGAYLTTEQFLEREAEAEAEEELNRAVFEHNSTATSDPHIRISHVSPIMPDNWQEIVNR